jgi:hypothetical protein
MTNALAYFTLPPTHDKEKSFAALTTEDEQLREANLNFLTTKQLLSAQS